MKLLHFLRKANVKLFLLGIPLLIYVFFNYSNLYFSFSFILGVLVFPYAFKVDTTKVGGYRYGIMAILGLLLLLKIDSNSLYYFSTIFILFFVIENWWGKLSYLSLFLAIIVSPIIGNIVYLWSFPIRLKLSKLAGVIFQYLGYSIEVQGNLLLLDGHSFAVDPACVGLKTIITALVLGIAILSYFEKQRENTISFWQITGFLFLILVGSILSNFVRLVLLILFRIAPNNPLHDIIGLLTLLVYILIPFYFLVKKTLKIEKTEIIKSTKLNIQTHKVPSMVVLFFLLGFQLYTGQNLSSESVKNISEFSTKQYKGYKTTTSQNGTIKLQNNNSLIYLKPPVPFYKGSHDPRYCWQGSGYNFKNIKTEQIENKKVYTSILIKGNEQFYTAWWYENNKYYTINEWEWRWKNFTKNQQFYLINISSTDIETLNKLIRLNWL